MKTRLVLMRHGETDSNSKTIFCGWTDSVLTKRGIKQAQLAGKYLDRFKFDRIYSSDLTRAVETACQTAIRQGLEIVKLQELREIYGGLWENKSADQILKEFKEQREKYFNGELDCQLEGGESLNQFKERAISVIKDIAYNSQGKTVLVVTHGGILRMLDGYLFSNKGWKDCEWYSNVGVTVAEFDGENFSLEQHNYSDFLGELRTDLDITKI